MGIRAILVCMSAVLCSASAVEVKLGKTLKPGYLLVQCRIDFEFEPFTLNFMKKKAHLNLWAKGFKSVSVTWSTEGRVNDRGVQDAPIDGAENACRNAKLCVQLELTGLRAQTVQFDCALFDAYTHWHPATIEYAVEGPLQTAA